MRPKNGFMVILAKNEGINLSQKGGQVVAPKRVEMSHIRRIRCRVDRRDHWKGFQGLVTIGRIVLPRKKERR